MRRVHPHLRWFLVIAFGCLITVGCSSDPEPATLPVGGETESVAPPVETSAGPTPAALEGEEEETSVTSDQPMTLAELAAGYLYDSTESLEFTTIDGVSGPCVWHFVRDTEVIGPGVSIFELADGSLVARDPVRVINACLFDGGEPPSAEAMARVFTTSGELGGFEVLSDESTEKWARRRGLTWAAPALVEDGGEWVLTFQGLNSNDFSVTEVTARRSADGTFTIDTTRHGR